MPGPAEGSSDDQQSHITHLLKNIAEGNQATAEAYGLLKDQLRQIAEREISSVEQLSVQASHIVDHVYLALVKNSKISWQGREHFLAYACKAIRNFLVDHARSRKAQKRGGGHAVANLASVAEPVAGSPRPDEVAELRDDLLKLDKILPTLERDHPDLSVVIHLHFFGGLSFERIGPLLGIDPGTARRRWMKARIILERAMNELLPEDEGADDENTGDERPEDDEPDGESGAARPPGRNR